MIKETTLRSFLGIRFLLVPLFVACCLCSLTDILLHRSPLIGPRSGILAISATGNMFKVKVGSARSITSTASANMKSQTPSTPSS